MMAMVVLDVFLQSYFRGRGMGMINQGVSFGLLSGFGTTIAVIVYIVFVFAYFRFKSGRDNLGLLLLIFGGLGNLLPRLIWGGVWDYLCLPIFPFWFNLSDVMISLGVVSYILMGDGNTDIV
ncbi:MAG: Lipoprotein signal peptidase [Microgenomates group bacterium GW2011_GWC1_44_10]|nr:MAG: Lipoprotein signal peptidase [Microgenomates group bacterium GW2011_GWC1_44_10]